MTDSALNILQREGEQRGDPADFDEHVDFYKGALRIARIFIALMAVLLLAMYFFLVK